MDPYLEAPDIWPDFHDALASEIRIALNANLPPPYYARLEMRPEVGVLGADESGRIDPDVTIVRPSRGAGVVRQTVVAVLERPRTELSASIRMRISGEPLRHHFVEIRDASRGHALVTVIEIASPSNKRPGPDRRAYQAKQQEILASETSLIELDLLRAGPRVVGDASLAESIARLTPPPDYLVAVNRAWQREVRWEFELFPIRLADSLPCIPVPLREGEREVPLDLQYVCNQAYAGGPYTRGGRRLREPAGSTASTRPGRLAGGLPGPMAIV
jgi:hypothetical protein